MLNTCHCKTRVLLKTDKCLNCNNHYNNLRPLVTEALVTHAFKKEVPDHQPILDDILNCGHTNFNELHKYEEKIEGITVFRAKKNHIHFVYVIDDKKRLILLRAFHNFREYKRFLENHKEILSMVRHL